MDLGGGCNERIHGLKGSTARFAAGDQSSPFIGNGSIHPDDSSLESQWQIITEPFVEPPAPGTGGQALNALAQLRERHNTQEDFALVDLLEPFDDPCIEPWLRPLGDDVRVEEKAHRSDARS